MLAVAHAESARAVQRLIVSAPFGNYVQPEGATATLGTFTAAARPGRLWRILKTVRWYPRLKAWVNKIGLRNPGMPWLVERVRSGRIQVDDKIVSVHGFQPQDWWALFEQGAAIRPAALELNMSCPNIGEISWPEDLFGRALDTGIRIIAKLPPVRFEGMFEQAWSAGVRAFHCCNTLPVDAGGLSGRPLKPVALQCIQRIQEMLGPGEVDQLLLIGGGGVRSVADVEDYAEVGVQHVAVGTKVMNPRYLFGTGPLDPLIACADRELEGRASISAPGSAPDREEPGSPRPDGVQADRARLR